MHARSVQIRCSSRLSRWRVISSSAPNGSSSRRIFGLDDQRPGDRHPLAHAARQLRGRAFSKPSRPTSLIRSCDRVESGFLMPAELERQPDVGGDRPPRQQRGVLERDAEVVVAAGRRRRLAVHQRLARSSASRGRRGSAGSSTCRSPTARAGPRRSPRRTRQVDAARAPRPACARPGTPCSERAQQMPLPVPAPAPVGLTSVRVDLVGRRHREPYDGVSRVDRGWS